jgi:hypothetical protein
MSKEDYFNPILKDLLCIIKVSYPCHILLVFEKIILKLLELMSHWFSLQMKAVRKQ